MKKAKILVMERAAQGAGGIRGWRRGWGHGTPITADTRQRLAGRGPTPLSTQQGPGLLTIIQQQTLMQLQQVSLTSSAL